MLAEAVQPAERHEQLPGAMNVDGIRLVVVIFRLIIIHNVHLEGCEYS